MGNRFSGVFAAESSSKNVIDSIKSGVEKTQTDKAAGDAPAAESGAGQKPENEPGSSKLGSPGTFMEIHRNCKDIFPAPFEGGRLTFNKGLSNHFQVQHNFNMSAMQPSGYKFGATYVGKKQLSPTESFPVLLGEIDPSGNMTAQMIHAFTNSTRSRLVAQCQDNQFQALEFSTEYKGKNFTAACTAGNPDLLAGTEEFKIAIEDNSNAAAAHGQVLLGEDISQRVLVAQYLQTIYPRVVVGTEMVLHRGARPMSSGIARQCINSFVAKYSADKWQAALQVSPLEAAIHASYWHKVSDKQQYGVEIEGKGSTGECVASAGYCFEIPGADCTVKAQIDSNYNIASTLEKKLAPLPMSLLLSCQGNQRKSQYIFGVGLTIG